MALVRRARTARTATARETSLRLPAHAKRETMACSSQAPGGAVVTPGDINDAEGPRAPIVGCDVVCAVCCVRCAVWRATSAACETSWWVRTGASKPQPRPETLSTAQHKKIKFAKKR